MNDKDLTSYLAAAAWADGPITGAEQDLAENLLFGLGLERDDAECHFEEWKFKAPPAPDLTSLTDRDQALALLRALLTLSYSDGHFGLEELPYLTRILDKFKVTSEELKQLRLQACYYLDPDAQMVNVPSELVEAGRWDDVEQAASQAKSELRAETENKIRKDLLAASFETLQLVLHRGRSYDLAEAGAEFARRRESMLERFGAMTDEQLLQAQIMLIATAKWERQYQLSCSECDLAAVGRRGDVCPRCGEDYGG